MRVQANGVSLFFEVEGSRLDPSRCTVVALHGGPGLDHTDVRPGLAPLAGKLQVVSLDQRGHGRSDRSTPDHWNLATWADDVRAFCDALAIESPIVVGNSFGGMVALSYALRHPGHAAKLVLVSTAAHFELEACMATFARLGGDRAAQIARRFFADPASDAFDDYVRNCLPLYMRRRPSPASAAAPAVHLDVARHFVGGEWHTFDLRPHLPRIASPTLVLAGEDDVVFPTPCFESLLASIPAPLLRSARFPTCGHALLADSPADVCAAIASFA